MKLLCNTVLDCSSAFTRMALPDRLLEHGDVADLPGWSLRAVHTPGHTPGHLCFAEERTGLLFSGDHVLPRITPNISTTHSGLADPLPLLRHRRPFSSLRDSIQIVTSCSKKSTSGRSSTKYRLG